MARAHLYLPFLARLMAATLICVSVPLTALQAQQTKTAAAAQKPLSAQERALLGRISARMNDVTTLQGRFLQISPDGTSVQGNFYLSRPQHMRFEYDNPSPLLIVSDGQWILISDRKANTLDRYPLGSTPFSVLLRSKIDLTNDENVRKVEKSGDLVRVTARARNNETPGEITLTFEEPSLALRQWTVIDAQGRKTVIALSGHKYGMALSPALFKVDGPGPRGIARRNN